MSEFGEIAFASLDGLQRVALLKKLEAMSEIAFRDRHMKTLSERDSSRVERVVFQSDLAGIEEFSDDWFYLISMKMKKVITFGEIMLRLSPKDSLRFSEANSFELL